MPQREFIGAGSLSNLNKVIAEIGVQSVFLVRSKQSFQSSGAESALQGLSSFRQVSEWHDFQVNPQLADVEKGVRCFRDSQSECIIAVGGGSVLDMAKLLKFFAGFSGDYAEVVKGNSARQTVQPVPFIAIPTTSGSGSEATHFAVVYIGKTKYSVAHPSLLPDVAIVDPFLTLGVSPKLTAITGMDALSQAVESYWSVNSTDESRQYASEAITLIRRNLSGAVNTPTNEARANMSVAAHLAGKAINITKTTAPHAISYTLTSHFGVPHGHAVALTLSEMLLFNAGATETDIADPRGLKFLQARMSEVFRFFGSDSAEGTRDRIRNLMMDIGLETQLSKVGVQSAVDIDVIVKNVNVERLQNNPRRLTPEGLRGILERIR